MYILCIYIYIWFDDPSWVLPSLKAGEASCVCYRYVPLASWFKTRLYSGHICSDDRYKSGTFEPYLLSVAWTWHASLVHYIEQFWWQQHLDSFKSWVQDFCWVYECIYRKLESKFPLIQKQSWSNCPPCLHHLKQWKWLSFYLKRADSMTSLWERVETRGSTIFLLVNVGIFKTSTRIINTFSLMFLCFNGLWPQHMCGHRPMCPSNWAALLCLGDLPGYLRFGILLHN